MLLSEPLASFITFFRTSVIKFYLKVLMTMKEKKDFLKGLWEKEPELSPFLTRFSFSLKESRICLLVKSHKGWAKSRVARVNNR